MRSPFRGWVLGDREMQNASPVMPDHEEDIKVLEANRGNREGESTETKLFTWWFSKNALHDCDGDPLRRTRYLLTLVSLMSKPSLSNSPWILGAPQSGFSRLMRRMSWRTSKETAGRPGRPCRHFQLQKEPQAFVMPTDDGGRS